MIRAVRSLCARDNAEASPHTSLAQRRTGRARQRHSGVGVRLATAIVVLVGAFGPAGAPRAEATPSPVLLGVYPSTKLVKALDEITALDSIAGVKHSLAGTFMALDGPDPATNVPAELDAAWNAGYTPFINLRPAAPVVEEAPGQPDLALHVRGLDAATTGDCAGRPTMEEIANGSMDDEMLAWATAFAAWSMGGTKRAFIAPFHEMNGHWYCYQDKNPTHFKLAYWRMQRIFADAGVPAEAVSWVFHPNSQSGNTPTETWPPFEDYYPGNATVDVVSFSAYNLGGCDINPANAWKTPQQLYGPYLPRMRAMAPGKAILIAETATTSRLAWNVSSTDAKNAWLHDALVYLSSYPAVRGIVYFNADMTFYEDLGYPSCDFSITAANQPGYNASSIGAFAYQSPAQLVPDAYTHVTTGVFDDAWPPQPFSGQGELWYRSYVEALAASGVTAGCRDDSYLLPNLAPPTTIRVRAFCPLKRVTRAEMAVFLLKGSHGSSYAPPAPDGSSPFTDLAGHWAEAWMEQLYDEGLTVGYPDGTYRPANQVTRAEMAVFLLKAKYGSSYVAPPPDGGSFVDVAGHWAERWIEQLKEEGITAGNPDGTYRPENGVTRAEMAVFLIRAFSLPYP